MKMIKNLPMLVLAVALLSACGSGENQNKEADDAEPMTMEGPNVVGEEITYTYEGVEMKGYIAYDKNAGGPRPGVLVVHEWWGHNEYARKRAEMLAELGYVALAVDMYGNGKQASHPQDAGAFSKEVMSNFDMAKGRFTEAMKTLQSQEQVSGESIAAIGYCFGGGVVLSMANAGLPLDAVVSFHGTLGLPVMPEEGKIKGNVLVLNGADDPFVTPEQIAAYTAAMDSAGASYKLVNYEGAVHAFTSKGADSLGKKFELPLAYNAAADEQSWEAMKKLLSETF